MLCYVMLCYVMLYYIMLYYIKDCLHGSTYYKVTFRSLEHIADTDNLLFKCFVCLLLFSKF